MTDYTPGTPPSLPVEALRDALSQADLEMAKALVDAHDRAVRLALSEQDALMLDPRQVQAWLTLIKQHEHLLQELGQLRSNVSEQLQQLQKHQRGANAYLRAME